MKKAILVDIHKTLLLPDGKPNKKVVKVIKALAKDFPILLFTAEDMTGVKFTSPVPCENFYYNSLDMDDVEKKLIILDIIESDYIVDMLIDNSKKICRAFREVGIDTMRFKSSE